MSFKNGSVVDNNNLKFFELRKYLVSNENNGINCISIDNSKQYVFISNENQLIVISIDHLLNFVWNKSVINEIIDKFEHFSIGLNFCAHLISISAKGFGTKAAVCGSVDENDFPFITFFDLNSIYENQNNSTAYSRINLMNSRGFVTDIVWHPEICDNHFGCVLTDGSVFIISIGDIQTKTTTILCYMSSPFNAMSLCWSPKGKQIVIGFKNGYFSQYKIAQHLQEVKRTVLVNNMNDYNVIAIKWIVSSLFAIACTKDVNESEKDTHIIVVSTPSKGLAQFVDFGAICLDNFETNQIYRINLLHFENMILCSSSVASDVAVIGCDPSKDISSPDNWCQWMLDDSSRIDFPMDRDGNDTYSRGFSISRGTQNTYKISSNEVYGGVNCPLLMVYNSSGLLLSYLIVVKSGDIKAPEAPNIVKTTVKPSVTSQTTTNTSTPKQSSITFNPQKSSVITNPNIPSFGSPFTPIVSSTLTESKATTNPTQQQMLQMNQISRIKTQSIPTQQSLSEDICAQKSNSLNLTQIDINSETNDNSSTLSANDLYRDAITEQINEFNKLMSATKKKFSQIKAKIGEKEEEVKLRKNTRLIEDVLEEIKENFKNCSKDTTTLQSSLIESFSLVEDAKSIIDRNSDPKYRFLLKERALDPITARRMEEINSLNEYITIQLRELDAKFEQEWYEWLEKRKSDKNSKSLTRIRSNTSCEMIYKSLANNQRVINCLRFQIEKLEGFSSPPKMKIKNSLIKGLKNESSNRKDIEKLAHSLKQSSIIDKSDQPFIDRVFKLKTFPEEKKSNLREFLENRPNVPIRRSVNVINSSSSRFISAIEKLKEKQKSLNVKKPESVSNVSNEIKLKISNNLDFNDNKTLNPSNVDRIVANEIVAKKSEKPINETIQKLDLKLPLQTFSLASNSSKQLFPSLTQDLSKSTAIKSTDSLQNASKPLVKPLVKQLSITPLIGDKNSSKTSQNTSQSLSLNKTKSQSTEKEDTVPELSPISNNSSKTVSFGNTTIINPIENIPESNDFKLDTITECTENSENVGLPAVNTSPFAAFKGFGGNVSSNDTVMPKLTFNLKTTADLFSLSTDSEKSQKSNESLPKYEDISPPTTPQKTNPNKEQEIEANLTESESSKPLSILKTTLTANPLNLNKENDGQKSSDESNAVIEKISDSIPTSTEKSISAITLSSEPTIVTSSVVTNISSSIPTTITTMPSLISSTLPESAINTSKQLFGSEPQISQKSEPISSPFSQTSFSQTPFASNSFSFGNIPSNSSNTTTFGQGFSFGGSTGFNSSDPKVTTTSSSGSLGFGQTNPLNSLSFCGLGGGPSPENANKNVFGGNFSIAQQTSQFTSTSQSSPFNVKPSSGGTFSGSFSSGSGVAQTGFGAFQQQNPQQSSPIFGSSPVFGGSSPAFGSLPSFGAQTQQSSFGSSPTFGGAPALGSLNSSFGSSQTTTGFGGSGFANPSNNSLTFGAIASTVQQTQQTSPFSSQSPFNSTQNTFGPSDQSQGFSFTQRRK